MDGLGAQARQARTSSTACCAARRTRRSSPSTAPSPCPPGVRYVITLDADTRLPRDAARALVGNAGASAQPAARSIRGTGRVVRATRVLQPRVTASLPRRAKARSSARLLGPRGHRPVHHRGLGRVPGPLRRGHATPARASTTSTPSSARSAGRVPENALLSHDLIEGIFARAGLVTDVELVRRLSRRATTWTRRASTAGSAATGSSCPGSCGACRRREARRNPLSIVARWKILDNLRRSLLERRRSVALLVAGWTLLPGSPLRVDRARRARGRAAAVLCRCCGAGPSAPLDRSWRAYCARWRAIGGSRSRSGVRASRSSPHQAWLMADAIVAHALRGSSSAGATCSSGRPRRRPSAAAATSAAFVPRDVAGVALGARRLLVAGRCASSAGGPGARALPVLAARGSARPALARLARRSPPQAPVRLERRCAGTRRMRCALRAPHLALLRDLRHRRRTTCLPPDNFQEDPAPVVAQRTSPTNIGLQLLSTVSARDLGWIGTRGAGRRGWSDASPRWTRLERFRGHFYNWYDTADPAAAASRRTSPRSTAATSRAT